MAEAEERPVLLKGAKDRFQGITVNTSKVNHQSDEEFEERLIASIAHWRESGVRGAWVHIVKEHSSLINICIKHGFDFHHARPGYVMMNQWLPKEEINHLPEFANQYLGAAGMAVNDKGQVLVITEKFHSTPNWKLPGGHANIGEEISDAAIRETFEETGVKCKFVSLLTFRHMHKYRHGLSDLYFICLLEPITEEINMCEVEIADCKWIDIDDWYNDERTYPTNKFIIETYRNYKDTGVSLSKNPVPGFNKGCDNAMYRPAQITQNGPNNPPL